MGGWTYGRYVEGLVVLELHKVGTYSQVQHESEVGIVVVEVRTQITDYQEI